MAGNKYNSISKPKQSKASKPKQSKASKPKQSKASKPKQSKASKPKQSKASKPKQSKHNQSDTLSNIPNLSRTQNGMVTNLDPITLNAKDLKPEIVETSFLTGIIFEDNRVFEVENSWNGLILLMLSLIYSKNTDKFMGILVDNNVLSEGININTSKIIYPNNEYYEVYRINGTPYYVEFRHDWDSYVKAIKGCIKALKTEIKTINLNIVPIGYNISASIERFSDTLGGLIEKNNLRIHIDALVIDGFKQKVSSTEQGVFIVLLTLNNIYKEKFEETALKYSSDTVGYLDKLSSLEGYSIYPIGGRYIFSSGDSWSLLRYLYNILIDLGENPMELGIEYKVIKVEVGEVLWKI